MALSAAELARAFMLDPSRPKDRGTLDAWLRTRAEGDQVAVLRAIIKDTPLPVRTREEAEAAERRRAASTLPWAGVDVPDAMKADLTDVDLRWLDRLPTDPAEVSESDARHLFTLRCAAKSKRDRRLLDTYLDPLVERFGAVKRRADLEAEVELARPGQATRLGDVPGARDVLRQAVTAELTAAAAGVAPDPDVVAVKVDQAWAAAVADRQARVAEWDAKRAELAELGGDAA